LARRSRRATQAESRACLGYPGRLMARAAVKAKQQARAKAAQPAKTRARGRRRHSGGGQSEPGTLLRPAAAPSEVGVRRARRRVRVQLRPRGSRLRRQRRSDRELHRPVRRQRRHLRLEGSGRDQEESCEGLPGSRRRVRGEGRPQQRDRCAQEAIS
jgi:hypothetical protein